MFRARRISLHAIGALCLFTTALPARADLACVCRDEQGVVQRLVVPGARQVTPSPDGRLAAFLGEGLDLVDVSTMRVAAVSLPQEVAGRPLAPIGWSDSGDVLWLRALVEGGFLPAAVTAATGEATCVGGVCSNAFVVGEELLALDLRGAWFRLVASGDAEPEPMLSGVMTTLVGLSPDGGRAAWVTEAGIVVADAAGAVPAFTYAHAGQRVTRLLWASPTTLLFALQHDPDDRVRSVGAVACADRVGPARVLVQRPGGGPEWTLLPQPAGEAVVVALEGPQGTEAYIADLGSDGPPLRLPCTAIHGRVLWSPDGRHLAFVGGVAPRERSLYLYEGANGCGPGVLAGYTEVTLGAFSRDGDRLVFIAADLTSGALEPFEYRLARRSPSRMALPSEAAIAATAWLERPDGTWVAVTPAEDSGT